jgi:low affinity Fe/Cu permease
VHGRHLGGSVLNCVAARRADRRAALLDAMGAINPHSDRPNFDGGRYRGRAKAFEADGNGYLADLIGERHQEAVMTENGLDRKSAEMPSDVDSHVSLFDNLATAVAERVAKAWFFAACVLVVVIWAPTVAFLDLDTWQLIINTLTTIITFLLVALLQNTQTRTDDAVQQKLNAIADALADLMGSDSKLKSERKELLAAVGLEDRESTE